MKKEKNNKMPGAQVVSKIEYSNVVTEVFGYRIVIDLNF